MLKMTKEKRQFWVILTIVFIGFIGISMPYLIFPALFLNPEYAILAEGWSDSSHALLLGVTLAAYPFGQFLGSPILGALSDDYGRKKVLSISLLIAGVCNLLSAFAIEWQQLTMLIASRFAAGLMEGNIAIARAMATDFKAISKHESFGKINAAASIAFLIGPFFGGILTDKSLFAELTAATPFYLVCVLFFALAGLSALILDQIASNVVSQARSFWRRINIVQRMKVLFVNKRLRFLMITSTLFTLAIDIFYEFGPVYLTVKWGLNPSDLMIYNGLLCVTLAIGNGWLANFISTRVSNRLAVIFSIGGLSLLLVAMVFINSTYLMSLQFALCGFLIGLGVTMLTVKISDSASDRIQGEVMGVQISLRVLGDAVICLLGGVFLLISSKIILVFAAGVSLLSMIYYMIRLRS